MEEKLKFPFTNKGSSGLFGSLILLRVFQSYFTEDLDPFPRTSFILFGVGRVKRRDRGKDAQRRRAGTPIRFRGRSPDRGAH